MALIRVIDGADSGGECAVCLILDAVILHAL